MNFKDIKLDKKTITFSLFAIMIFALLTRLLAGYTYYVKFDLLYYIRWSTGLHEGGLFNAYEYLSQGNFALDYPPLFLFPLYIVGFFTKNPEIIASNSDYMLALKMFQILFDVAIIPLIYWAFHKKSEIMSLIACGLWAINPAMIINSAYWGQTDSLMIMLLFVTFKFMDDDRIYLGTFFYCLSCLAKFQSAYFAPVFLLYLLFTKNENGKFTLRNLEKLLTAIAVGVITVLGVFLPFMYNSSQGILLPFKVYFGGLGKYQRASYNAFNFYAAIGQNSEPDYNPVIGPVTLGTIGNILLVVIVALIILLYFYAPKKSPWLLCFTIMQSVFMLTTRMHERYQIPVLIFLIGAYFIHEDLRFLKAFFYQSVLIFINEATVFLWWTHADSKATFWYQNFDLLVIIVSIINFLYYIYTMWLSVRAMYKKEEIMNAKLAENTEM